MSNFVYRGVVRNAIGEAVPGVQIFVCNQPLTSGTNIPPAPLATLYASATAPNTADLDAAEYIGGFIEFTFTGALPADVVPGSFISVSGVAPTGYNQVWQVVAIDTVNFIVTVTLPFTNFAPNPGTYISGGAVATSALPNPLLTDGNGNFSFYTASGFYTLVLYDPADRIPTIFLPDTPVLSAGSGTVTSVAMTVPDGFAITGSPITGAGTLGLAYSTDWSIGEVIAGPVSGPSAAPTRRRLTATDVDDLPDGTVTSVGLDVTTDDNLTADVTNSPVTDSGTIDVSIELANMAANTAIMGPTSGAAAPPTARIPQSADLTAWGAVQLGGDLGGTSPNLPEVIGFLGTEKLEFPLFFFVNGPTTDGAKLFRNSPPIGQTWKFPANAPDATALASAAATSNATFTFKKNGTPFATLLYAASSAAGVWTQATDEIFVGGTDYLEVDCPATHDATLADVGINYPYLRVA